MLSFSCAYWPFIYLLEKCQFKSFAHFILSYCWALRVLYIYIPHTDLFSDVICKYFLSTCGSSFHFFFFVFKMCLVGWFPIHLVSGCFLKNIYLLIYWLCWCGLSLVAVHRLLIVVSSLTMTHRLNPKSQRYILFFFFFYK